MTLYRFNQLSEEEKRIAMHDAVLIADREEPGCNVYLFQLDGFYIETYCYSHHPERDCYKTFCSIARLEPYLQKIEINLSCFKTG